MPEAVEKLGWTQAQFNPSTKALHPYVYDKMLRLLFPLPWRLIDLICSSMQFVNIGILKGCRQSIMTWIPSPMKRYDTWLSWNVYFFPHKTFYWELLKSLLFLLPSTISLSTVCYAVGQDLKSANKWVSTWQKNLYFLMSSQIQLNFQV